MPIDVFEMSSNVMSNAVLLISLAGIDAPTAQQANVITRTQGTFARCE